MVLGAHALAIHRRIVHCCTLVCNPFRIFIRVSFTSSQTVVYASPVDLHSAPFRNKTKLIAKKWRQGKSQGLAGFVAVLCLPHNG